MKLVVTGTPGVNLRSGAISALKKSMVWCVTNRRQSRSMPWVQVSPRGEGDSICDQSVKVWLQKAVHQA